MRTEDRLVKQAIETIQPCHFGIDSSKKDSVWLVPKEQSAFGSWKRSAVCESESVFDISTDIFSYYPSDPHHVRIWGNFGSRPKGKMLIFTTLSSKACSWSVGNIWMGDSLPGNFIWCSWDIGKMSRLLLGATLCLRIFPKCFVVFAHIYLSKE